MLLHLPKTQKIFLPQFMVVSWPDFSRSRLYTLHKKGTVFCPMGQKNCTLNNFVKSRSILIIFGTQDTWMNLQRMVIKLSTSPNECHYTTLWNTTCVNLFITTVMEALNVRHDKLTVTDKHITTSVCLWLFLTRAFSVSSGNFAECLCVWCVPLTSMKCQFLWRSDG